MKMLRANERTCEKYVHTNLLNLYYRQTHHKN